MTHCGYCKSKNSTFQYPTHDIHKNDYEIHQCQDCKAFFLAPYPDEARMAQAYDASYYGEGDEKFNEGIIEKILDYFRNQRARRIAKHINNKGRVLDIGCGNGRFLEQIQHHGDIESYGIEMPGGSAGRAKALLGNRLNIGSLDSNDYPNAYFDAITLFHVFEHLTEPKQYLDQIFKLLKPGGILYMSFPNIDSFQAKWFKGDWLHLDPPRHLFFFTPDVFRKEMEKYGFYTLHERHFNLEYNPFGFQQSLLNKIYAKRELLYESLKGNTAYTNSYSTWNLKFQNIAFKLTAPLFILSDFFESSFGRGATVEFTLIKRPKKPVHTS